MQGVNRLNSDIATGSARALARERAARHFGRMASPHSSGEDHVAAMQAVAQSRDRAAFALLFNHFAPRVKAYLMRLGSAADVAEDLAQDVMITIWNRAGTYDPRLSGVATWIFTIARNRRIDVVRKTVRPMPDGDDPVLAISPTPSADETLLQGQRERILGAAIGQLPEEQAHLLRLAFYEDRTHSDIAAQVRLPLGTVKSRLRLALAKLRGTVGSLS